MVQKLLVSVVIPCYNQGHFLKEALESVENSTYPRIEVIVIDDGSTDQNTIEHIDLLSDFTVKGRTVKFIRQRNQGLSASRNNAIRESEGEFILPLDADDMIDSTYIEKSVWVLAKYPDISIVYPSVQHFGVKTDIWNPCPYDFFTLLKDNFMIATSMFRKKVWEDVKGYDIDLPAYEDWDFWIRAGALGYKGYWLREPLFFYRKQEDSMLVAANKRRKKLIRIIRKKNKEIYKLYKESFVSKTNKKQNSRFQLLRHKISVWKWKTFVLYVHVASRIPISVKEKVRRFIKPVIRKLFKYHETVYEQSLVENIETTYIYNPTTDYIQVLNEISSKNKKGEKLSILFVAPWLQIGGADKVNLDLISAFCANGHDIHLFTTLLSEHKWYKRFKGVIKNITHLGNSFSNIDDLLDYVIDYIFAKNISVIQMSNSELGYQIAEVIKKYCPHVKIVDLLHMEEPYYPIDHFRYSVKFKDFFDHRVVITPYLKEAMIRKYGEVADRVTVIHNGIEVVNTYEETNYPAKSESKGFVIGFIGRMEDQKQPLDVIRTAKLVLEKYDNVRFIMVGDGSLLKSSMSLAKSLGIADKVEFLGRRDDALTLMRNQFDIFLAPSLREGLPIVGLEALSLGVPIVATAVPGWVDLVFPGETGFLASTGDYNAFADACVKLITNTQLRIEISQKAYKFAKEVYSLEKTASMYLDIYYNLNKMSDEIS